MSDLDTVPGWRLLVAICLLYLVGYVLTVIVDAWEAVCERVHRIRLHGRARRRGRQAAALLQDDDPDRRRYLDHVVTMGDRR